MAAVLISLSADALNTFGKGGIYYQINTGVEGYSVSVYGISNIDIPEHLIIPETVEYSGHVYTVTGIYYNGLSVTIDPDGRYEELLPNNITTTVTIPETVTGIGGKGFWRMTKLTKINFPQSLRSLSSPYTDLPEYQKGAFTDCTSLKQVILPPKLKYIGKHTFNDCTALETIVLPDSIKTIEKGTFKNCTSLKAIDIPDAVKEIGIDAFDGCKNLAEVNLSDNSQLETIDGGAFSECYALEQFKFPASLRSISTAFSYSGLKSVVVPENVQFSNFSGCYQLRSATILGDVETLAYTFRDCSKLTEVHLPGTITELEWAFYGCKELREVNFGNSIGRIGSNTFTKSGIRNIHITPSVKEIACSAFDDCAGLTSLTIEDSPEELVFTQMSTVEQYDYPWGIISSPVLQKIYMGRQINDARISGCSETLEKVTFGPQVKSIGKSLLVNMPKIQGISIPDAVETIGANAFKGCNGLTVLHLGTSLREIGDHAFDGARNLTTIYSANPTPPDIYSETFLRVNKYDCTVYVPIGSAERYRHTDYWNAFQNFVEKDILPSDGISETVADGAAVRLEGGRLVLTGADTRVTVYAADGRLVADRRLSSGESLELPSRGLYIVTAAGRSFKICY